ncbi:DUF6129 family protein [Azomonas macrocytogenes]|uniref:DUF6129 domain-containing protein n=1 Tax=Azomonas macrocytogenes TaxID=69962 RepID=A0A839T485_AZOMA|nr:DUF6129 family protein [Azomonas macrocytogenes]MBB3103898.1 hypothetical protein [Azomonas macrocytogenes]
MISQTQLDEIIREVEQSSLDDALLARLRNTYPGIHFTHCMDDDIVVNAKPVAEKSGFNLYLVNSSDHCSVLTNDTQAASGVVLAEVIED